MPNAKVIAGALGGAVATIVLWLVSFYGGVDLPAEVAAAVTTIIVAIVAYLTSEPLPEGQGYIEIDVLPDEPE